MNSNNNNNSSSQLFKIVILAGFILATVLLSIGSPYPEVMLLHHSATILIALFLIWVIKLKTLSNLSFVLIVFYALLHVLGARWTYLDVPYDLWSQRLLGLNLSDCFGWQRNQYDRLVHFAFGLLLWFPVVEIAQKWFGYKPSHSRYLAWEFIAMASLMYELFEWGLTFFVPENQAVEYNGQQGDIWDAQKDMALAVTGACLALLFNFIYRRCFKSRSKSGKTALSCD